MDETDGDTPVYTDDSRGPQYRLRYRLQARVVKLGEWKLCDICRGLNVPAPEYAEYDARLKLGTWAFVCQRHMEEYGTGLGIGLGVRITK